MSSPRLAPGAELLTRCAVCSLHRSLRAGQCDRRRRYFCPRCCCTGPNGRKQPNTVSSLLIPHASPVPAAVVCVYLYLSNVLINVPRISTAYRDGCRMLFMFFPRSRPQQHIVGPPLRPAAVHRTIISSACASHTQEYTSVDLQLCISCFISCPRLLPPPHLPEPTSIHPLRSPSSSIAQQGSLASGPSALQGFV